MSRPSRTSAENKTPRHRRVKMRIEAIEHLEERQLLAPYIPTGTRTAEFTAFDDQPDTQNFGTVTVTFGEADLATSAAAYVSVSQFTPSATFGGDTVRIEAGPGGDFGKGLYAITRGSNTVTDNGVTTGGRPGVIYRLDPATGKGTVFFDLNQVVAQRQAGGDAAASAGTDTGLVNWYDISFDPEGYFDGRPSMFVSSIDRTDPNKNLIYRIAPDGTLMSVFTTYTAGADTGSFTRGPSAINVPPPQQQNYLRGLISGTGLSPSPTNDASYTALFFDSNQFRPGQNIQSQTITPLGVTNTQLTFGPQVAIVSANNRYFSPVYSAFTNFGTPGIPGFSPPSPGLSGVQGLASGELLIQNNTGVGNAGTNIAGGFVYSADPADDLLTLITTQADGTNPSGVDAVSAISTSYRRFQDASFDQYGYFSYGTTVVESTAGRPTVGTPVFAGGMFVSDLASGLAVQVDFPDAGPDLSAAIPVQGPGIAGIQFDPTTGETSIQLPGGNLGGRIVRILPDGTVSTFAEGFNTSGEIGSGSFVESSLSISFSADGTVLYAADNDGIWQFKSVASLAGSTTGSLIGLNDLRTLGIPFQGEDSAVAVIDTGIDAQTPGFRGRVAVGKNVITNGRADDDLAGAANGHGTLVAGVIAQFVPQATLQPVTIFSPLIANPNNTTSQAVYQGMQWVARNPFVRDPIRPNQQDRIIAAALPFGTINTYDSEGSAFRQYRQVSIALKSQLQRMRKLGIQPIAAAGQLGAPNGDATNVPAGAGDVNGMAIPAVFNEVISVTGSYPFPYTAEPTTAPTDPTENVIGRAFGPVLVFENNLNTFPASLTAITAGDTTIFQSKILASSNRSMTTDFAAPALDIPTFRRTFAGDGDINMAFQEGGTSLSSGIVTGSYALVQSSLDFYNELAAKGFTVNAYLTQPVNSTQLNYGHNALRTFEAYNNPDGINAILAWTAVPTEDGNFPGSFTDAETDPPFLIGQSQYRDFARIDVGNAVAAIEGSLALDYLIRNDVLQVIDTNNNGELTAQEIQTFVDRASTIGMAEAGSMARMLGGTARIPGERFLEDGENLGVLNPGDPNFLPAQTAMGERPDQPDVLQRRYNFFDYAADGQLDGVVSVAQLRMLSHTLLPPPDAFPVTNRPRASAGGFLLDPGARRNFTDLQHTLPSYAFANVPQRVLNRYAGFSPNKFGVGAGANILSQSPVYQTFERGTNRAENLAAAKAAANNGRSSRQSRSSNSNTPSTTTPTTTTPSTTTPSTTTPSTSTTPTSSNPTTSSSSTKVTSSVTNDATTTTSQPTSVGQASGLVAESEASAALAAAIAATTTNNKSNTETPSSAPALKNLLDKQDKAAQRSLPTQLAMDPAKLEDLQSAYDRRNDLSVADAVQVRSTQSQNDRLNSVGTRVKRFFGLS